MPNKIVSGGPVPARARAPSAELQPLGRGGETVTDPTAIVDYFDELDSRIETVRLINNQTHTDEALLLSCAYLDSLASLRYRNPERSHFYFVKLLDEHSRDQRLGLVHPIQFLHALNNHRSAWSADVSRKTETKLLQLVGTLYETSDFRSRLRALLSADEIEKVRENLWRGTLASIIYTDVRCELVHGIAPSISPHSVNLSTTTWNQTPVGPIDFGFVHTILKSVSADLRSISLVRSELFGHGFK